ncbi:uncharacterized protein LOC113347507 isoform X2 [Papaver somniferum]|uniref:uncharacterized protein LOC113347507 isoform X2 n=1 Tax=Papaver somniferum TaxID=3469 RepID=UPI000E6F83AC|nr:uncharacterized protein LOC113347507 isoform X2 [Papaver somniferum]
MAQFEHNDDFEYLNDDVIYDINDFEDNPFEEFGQQMNDRDSDDVNVFNMNEQKTDTTAYEARNGKDIQGIPWERFNFGRDKYRQNRLKQYKNFQNLSRTDTTTPQLYKECKQVDKGNTFYDFQFNTRLVKSTIVHFQLRNLLWATSKHDVYLLQNYSVMHWSALLRRGKEVLNVAGPIAPTMKEPGSLAQSLSRVQISTMAVKDNFMAAGGFRGELVCKHLNRSGVEFCTKITSDDTAITNSVDIYQSPSGLVRVMAANNDAQVRIFDAETFVKLNQFSFSWSVNNISVSPDGKQFAVLGDSTDCVIADIQNGKGT